MANSLTLAQQRGCQSSLHTPAVGVNTLSNYCSRQTQFDSPNMQGCSAPPKSQQSSTSIARKFLFYPILPQRISRFVITVIVNTSNGMRRAWRRTNVGKEIFKFLPSLTNGNSSSSVSIESLHRWITAPAQHGIPCSPFFRSPAPSTLAVPKTCFHNAIIWRGA